MLVILLLCHLDITKFNVLYNSSLRFHERLLYAALDVDLCRVRLHEPRGHGSKSTAVRQGSGTETLLRSIGQTRPGKVWKKNWTIELLERQT